MSLYKWRFGDENIVANLRRRWPAQAEGFTDLQLAHLYSEFSLSEDCGENDEKFPEWLAEGPLDNAAAP